MRSGVIALRRFTNISVHNCFELLSKMDRLASLYFVGTHALHWHHAAVYIRDHVARAVAEDADVTHLSTGIGVKGRVIEDDFAFLAWFQFGNALSIFDDSENFAVARDSLLVTFEDRLTEIAVDRARRLLSSAFPRCA